MRYLITLTLDDDDARIDTTSPTGLSLLGFDQVQNGLLALGFEDIEISGDGG